MASRMSRMRRSTLQSRPLSHDPCEFLLGRYNHLEIHPRASIEAVNKLPRVLPPASDIDHPRSVEDKQRDREATMRKLMGQRSPVTSDFPRSKAPSDHTPPTPPKPSTSTNKPQQESISLAAFMGSRETGPRKNKHAPQQDVRDPTQFEQRKSIASPHPVFGKSGVAMPGLVPKSPGPQSRTSPRLADMEVASSSMPPLNLRERKISTPAVARRYVEKVESEGSPKPSPLPKPRDKREHVRERTMSTPSGPGPNLQRYTGSSKPSPPGVGPIFVNKQSHPLLRTHNSLSASSTPDLHRHSYTPRPLSKEVKPDLITLPLPAQNLRPSSSPPTTPSRPAKVINTPTLTRPVEPKPKPPIRGPTVVSYNRSPAFSDRTPPKGATPSLSRLQGRGFVQNMIKASAELESSTGTSPFPTPERTRSEPQKKVSALDRWTNNGPATSASVISLPPVPMHKAKTFDPVGFTVPGSPVVPRSPGPISIPRQKSQTFEIKTHTIPPASKSPPKGILVTSKGKERPVSTSLPTSSNEHVPGIGSSNTLVSYIKPMKTGDSEPPTPLRSKTPIDDGADELGIRKRKSSGKLREKSVSFAAPSPTSKPKSVVDVLPSPSKPLSHVRPLRC